jgi:hypothetical protein
MKVATVTFLAILLPVVSAQSDGDWNATGATSTMAPTSDFDDDWSNNATISPTDGTTTMAPTSNGTTLTPSTVMPTRPAITVVPTVPADIITAPPDSNDNNTTVTAAPTPVNPASCQANKFCALLNLTGNCCPTDDNWTLECCSGHSFEATCESNPKCAALGLQGACCPTAPPEWWLDCCESIPDRCGGPGACPAYTVRAYQERVSGSFASPLAACWGIVMRSLMGLTVVMTLV